MRHRYLSILAMTLLSTASADRGTPVTQDPIQDSVRIAQQWFESRHFPDAERLGRRLLVQVGSAAAKESLTEAALLDLVVGSALSRGITPPDMRTLAERAVELRRRLQGAGHPDFASSLNQLARVTSDLDDYAGAVKLYRQAIAIREKVYGPADSTVGEMRGLLGWTLYASDSMEAARKELETALAIQERALGTVHPKLLRTLKDYAAVVSDLGDDERGCALYERAISVGEAAFGKEDPVLVSPLMGLGRLYLFDLNDFKRAQPLLERAHAIATTRMDPEARLAGISCLNLGELCFNTGEPTRALELYQEGRGRLERILGPNGSYVAWALADIGAALMGQGDLSEALPLLQRSLQIRERVFGPEGYDLSYTLIILGELYSALGEMDKAVSALERAVRIREKVLGVENFMTVEPVYRLGEVLVTKGDLVRAKSCFERSARTIEKCQGGTSTFLTNSLMGLASIRMEEKRFDVAAPLVDRALRIIESKGGYADLGWILVYKGILALERGDARTALESFQRAVESKTQAFGPNHPDVAWALSYEAQALQALNRPRDALEAAVRSEAIARDHLRLTIRTLAERQALQFASVRTSSLDLALEITAEGAPDAGAPARAWDALIRSRALVLDEMAARRRRSARKTETDSLFASYVHAQQRMANLLVRGVQEISLSAYRGMLDQAREASENAERALAAADVSFREENLRSKADLAEVLKALPSGTALVGYARYWASGIGAKKGSPEARPGERYLAFVCAGAGAPHVVALGDASKVDALVEQWRREATAPAHELHSDRGTIRRYRAAAIALRRAVWDPVADHLEGAERVFVVPDGQLHMVNLAALSKDDGTFLVEHGPLIHCVSVERDLIPIAGRHVTGQGLLALGDPDYDAAPEASTSHYLAQASSLSPSTGSGTFRGHASRCPELAKLHWERLPATREEIDDIAKTWRRGNSIRTNGSRSGPSDLDCVLQGTGATEEAFKERSPGRQVLHVATHGFFLGGGCRSALPGNRGIGAFSWTADKENPLLPEGSPRQPSLGENPFLLSGLVLAGANHRKDTPVTADDGILTAEEIAALDLSTVEWAVLSACETGVGTVRWREGVFGLRRAFQRAGVGTLIMSLWPVDDEATRRWMRFLYEARFGRGLNSAEAVRDASIRSLQDRRARGESIHPFYWASFLATGDWR